MSQPATSVIPAQIEALRRQPAERGLRALPVRVSRPAAQAPAIDTTRFLTTVLMTDIVDSTATAAAMGDGRWTTLLAAHYADCRLEIGAVGGELIDTTGDGVIAIFDAPTRAIRAGLAIAAAARVRGLGVRAGVHTGECERIGGDVAGLAVHVAARVCRLAAADEVVATRTVRELVLGSLLAFEPRGVETLRGLPGEWPVFRAGDPAR